MGCSSSLEGLTALRLWQDSAVYFLSPFATCAVLCCAGLHISARVALGSSRFPRCLDATTAVCHILRLMGGVRGPCGGNGVRRSGSYQFVVFLCSSMTFRNARVPEENTPKVHSTPLW